MLFVRLVASLQKCITPGYLVWRLHEAYPIDEPSPHSPLATISLSHPPVTAPRFSEPDTEGGRRSDNVLCPRPRPRLGDPDADLSIGVGDAPWPGAGPSFPRPAWRLRRLTGWDGIPLPERDSFSHADCP